MFARHSKGRSRSVLLLAIAGAAASVVTLANCSDDETTNPAPTPDGASDAPATDAPGSSDAPSGDTGAPNDSGGGDASDGGASLAVTDGGPFGLVYVGALNGIDQRVVSATLTADGALTGYYALPQEAPFLVTGTPASVNADSLYSTTAWKFNSTYDGPFFDDGGVKTLPSDQWFGVARVPASLPASGTATYKLIAATHVFPTLDGGVASGSATASFAGDATVIGFTLSVDSANFGTIAVTGNGGAGSTSADAGAWYRVQQSNAFSFQRPKVVSINANCPADGGCPVRSSIATFSGANCERLIIAYAAEPQVQGVVVFERE